jgi:hexosaminidase
LTDGLKGNGNYKTGRWIGFYRNDMDVTIDLLEPTEISNLTFTTCVEKGDWIFDARSVTVEVSEDGENYTEIVSESSPAMKETDRNGLYEHAYSFNPVKTRFVRVIAASEKSIPEWHGGKGHPGFLFVDEITID